MGNLGGNPGMTGNNLAAAANAEAGSLSSPLRLMSLGLKDLLSLEWSLERSLLVRFSGCSSPLKSSRVMSSRSSLVSLSSSTGESLLSSI